MSALSGRRNYLPKMDAPAGSCENRRMILPARNTNGRTVTPRDFILPLLGLGILLLQVFARGFYEADELTHFLKARDAWLHPHEFLDIWGRPLCTGLYALVAPFGLTAARLLAVIVTITAVAGTLKLAERLLFIIPITSASTRNFWIPILLLAQPYFLLNAAAIMTEMLLATCWIWAAVLLANPPGTESETTGSGCRRSRAPLLASILVGLSALARPEGIFAVIVWPAFLWLRNKGVVGKHQDASALKDSSVAHQSGIVAEVKPLLFPALISAMPLLLWYILGVWAWHDPFWPIHRWPWSTVSQYGRTPLKFLTAALGAMAFWMWIPAAAGIYRILRSRQRDAVFLLVVPTLALFALHGLLGAFGLFGSMSLGRYFLSVSPMLAILTFYGLEGLKARRIAVILAPIPLAILVISGQYPAPAATDQRKLDVAITAARQLLTADEMQSRIIAAHPYVFYRLNLPLDSAINSHDRNALRTARPRTILITDSTLWDFEGSPNAADLIAWGYAADPVISARIDAVPTHFDITAFKGKSVTVRVWIKQRAAVGGKPY
jgi:hypothetical protein